MGMKYKEKNYKDKNGLIIITPEKDNKIPSDCSVCKLALRNIEDVISYKKWGCCKLCQEYFAYPNKEEWENGWRPSKEEINRVSFL